MKSCSEFSFLPDMKQATADFYLVFYVLAYFPDFLFDIIASFYLFFYEFIVELLHHGYEFVWKSFNHFFFDIAGYLLVIRFGYCAGYGSHSVGIAIQGYCQPYCTLIIRTFQKSDD